ncbi:MAG: glutamate racemase [Treponema sp.]|nr:glutamate racemase [Treponema sp.]
MDKVDFAFLDSGTGGIPYMISLHEKLPASTFVYLGDTIHFPYGEKSYEEVVSCAEDAIKKIIALWNPRTIVIACNTISVTALAALRKKFPDRPIIGTVPAIKLGAKVTKNKKIGLLATNATVNHPYCKKLISDFAADCDVFMRGDPELVSFIEHRYFTSSAEEKKAAIKGALDFFTEKGCDTIILGCTHFTHIADDFKKAAGEHINIIDSREGVSNQAALKLKTESAKSEPHTPFPADKNLSFFVTHATAEEVQEYELLCARLSIPWGGVI